MGSDLELALAQLADESRPVRSIDLTPFSDLARERISLFRTSWAELSYARRLEAISTMVDQGEANIHLNFRAVLRCCLNDSDAQVRRLAVEGLWEDERPSLVGPLLGLLEADQATEVRAVAAASLGRFVLMGVLGDLSRQHADQVEIGLRKAWSRSGEINDVRRRVLESLATSENPDVNDLIESAYYDEDELMRQSAVFAMGRTADWRWARYVSDELRSSNPAIRFEAAASAGELRLTPAVTALIRLMDDADGNVREAATLALGKIGGKAAERALRAALQGPDERLAARAEEALEEIVFNSDSFEVGHSDDITAGLDGESEEDDTIDPLAEMFRDDVLSIDPRWREDTDDELDEEYAAARLRDDMDFFDDEAEADGFGWHGSDVRLEDEEEDDLDFQDLRR